MILSIALFNLSASRDCGGSAKSLPGNASASGGTCTLGGQAGKHAAQTSSKDRIFGEIQYPPVRMPVWLVPSCGDFSSVAEQVKGLVGFGDREF